MDLTSQQLGHQCIVLDGDVDRNQEITVDEILMAVNFALTDCPLTPAEQR